MRGLQLVFGTACILVALPLIFRLGPAEAVTNVTSMRILGAALLSLAVGAFSAAQDPLRHRIILRVETVFTALAAAFLIFRIVTDSPAHWWLLPPTVLCLILLLVLAPRADGEAPRHED
jgi:hypothetical protein